MVMEILPCCLKGRVRIPPSKSAAHRALICAALADGESIIRPAVLGADVEATLSAARALGAEIEVSGGAIHVRGVKAPPKSAAIDCGESGSTLRFFVPIAAALGVETVFSGRGKLAQRPMAPLLDALCAHGARVKSAQGEIPAVSGALQSGVYQISGSVSSQYITGLLFALPLLQGDSELRLTSPLESRGYVDMTVQMMEHFGVKVNALPDSYRIPGGQRYRPAGCAVEGDYSSGAFWLCAGALNSDVYVEGLEHSSLQGDKQIIPILQRFGAQITTGQNSVGARHGRLVSTDIDVRDIPDLVPVLAALACYANGTTIIYNAGRLRLKESDRLMAVTQGLKNLGAGIVEYSDKLVIIGQASLRGGAADAFGDHRIAMAMSIAALGCDNPVRITGAECVAKSYPDFYDHFVRLGGNCYAV